MDSEWSPQKVAELYEHAEKARQRAEALAKRPTALQLEDELQPSFVSLQLSVRGGPRPDTANRNVRAGLDTSWAFAR